MLQYFVTYIRSKDDIVKPVALQIHLEGNKNTKSFWGGFVSMAITLYMTFIIFDKSRDLITKYKPSTSSLR